MKKDPCVILIGPTSYSKQRSFLNGLITLKQPSSPDITEVKQCLRQQRLIGIEMLPALLEKAQKCLSTIEGVNVHWAENPQQAANIVQEIAGEVKSINVNKSATVNEISQALKERDIELISSYMNDYFVEYDLILNNKFEYFWQLPIKEYPPEEEWFAVRKKIRFNNNDIPPVADSLPSLVGINALSAEDGTMFFLQHTSNIGKLLQANKLIVLVGLEKVVPTQSEAIFQTRWAGNFGLESMLLDLDLSKRNNNQNSSTEKITENRIHKDTERQIDVIFLNNGRLKILDTPFRELLLCLSCRSCIKRCPNYKYYGKHSGHYPQQYLFSFLTEQNPAINLCAQCGNCYKECPVGIDLPMLFTRAKYLKYQRNQQMGDYLLANPEILAKASKINAPLSDWIMNQKAIRLVMEFTFGIHRDRQLPAIQPQTLASDTNEKDIFSLKEILMEKETKKTVIYYPGCFATYYEPNVIKSAVKLLEASGFRVIIPNQNCCGVPLIALGDIPKATEKAEQLIANLNKPKYFDIDIVTTCPSCSLALKHDYIALGIKGSEQVAKRVYDLENYLLMLRDSGEFQLDFERLPVNVAYHMPCHLRVQGVEKLPLDFLGLVAGLSIYPINRGCCGMSGTFGQKKKYYDYSMKNGKPLFEAIQNTEASFVCTECGPCKLQIVQGTGKKTFHPIVLLAELAMQR